MIIRNPNNRNKVSHIYPASYSTSFQRGSPVENKKEISNTTGLAFLHKTDDSVERKGGLTLNYPALVNDFSKNSDHINKLKSTIDRLGKMLGEKNKSRSAKRVIFVQNSRKSARIT